MRITPEAVGPVSLVTAFEQPDVKTPEVRVVDEARAPASKPRHRRARARLLMVDFPNTGVAASRPPRSLLAMAQGEQSNALEVSEPASRPDAVASFDERPAGDARRDHAEG